MNKTYHFLGHIGFALVMIGIGSLALMYLWNALMPDIFGLGKIDCLQALGLLLLARIMFGGMGGAHRWLGIGHRMHHRGRLREKWMNMTDDERKEFVKHHIRHHHCHHHEPDKHD
ncbi:MAG: hypothetical protein LBD28_04075 [Tannerellaceae bacterium]|jgi:hypothetical protein|nr:hypothetical protein [Tannerellaceae bacterium]